MPEGPRATGGQPQRGKDLAHPSRRPPLHEVFGSPSPHLHALAGQRIR